VMSSIWATGALPVQPLATFTCISVGGIYMVGWWNGFGVLKPENMNICVIIICIERRVPLESAACLISVSLNSRTQQDVLYAA
jgi:hypothetical protein